MFRNRERDVMTTEEIARILNILLVNMFNTFDIPEHNIREMIKLAIDHRNDDDQFKSLEEFKKIVKSIEEGEKHHDN